MPLGVPLATGIQISVDGQAIGTVPFDICRRDGCLADLLLNDSAVNAFKAGSKAQARVASRQGEGINLPILQRGFKNGRAAWRERVWLYGGITVVAVPLKKKKAKNET